MTELKRRRRALAARVLAPIRRIVRPLDFRRVDECRRVLQWLAPACGERILDIGCGDGHYDRWMAQRGAMVDATDVSADRVALACRWNPHARVRFHIMAGERLSFADSTFDKCVSICVLEHTGEDEAVLRQVARVLRPGGRFVLSCDSLSNSGISEPLRMRHGERYAVRRFYTRDSLRARLERAGLTLVRSEYVLTTPVSLAITRFTYYADDLGRLPFGWLVKYPAAGLAGSVGILASRASEYLMRRTDEGLTLIAEAVKPI